ncbi:MAG: hypothetical protein VYE26_07330 [Pseudomonadota bacterium]|nr:hypothetical protein [Pseudomonadota bacterium]
MPKYNLSSAQWDELIQAYVELVVDSMDTQSLEEFVIQTITQDLSEIESREALCDEISYTFDEDTLQELVDNVTTTTYSLNVNESITFPCSSE